LSETFCLQKGGSMVGNRRHICIGLATGAAIMMAGGIAFRDSSEGATQAIALVGFFSIFVVFHFLDERARRRQGKGPQ
jgi:hypothetical protein